MSASTTQRTMSAPSEEAFDELRRQVSGRLITSTDPDYDRVRTPWTVNVEQWPAAVLEVASAGDVAAAVRWASRHQIGVTAQPSGHAARSLLDGSLMLRTRALGDITVDSKTRLATVGAGVKFGELCAALDGTGLMALSGSNADPTVVGLTLGGGVSWFSRAHGFTANSVESFDVVDAAGELVRVTADTDPELFWALRGGGGDFAIVVALTLRLFDAPQMYGGQLLWPIEEAPKVLRAFRDMALVAPRELSLWANLLHFPPLDIVPEPMRGRSFVNVAVTYLGSRKMAEILLWSLRDSAPVEFDLMGEFMPSQLTEVAAEPSDPMPALEHGQLLSGLDDLAIDDLVAIASDPTTLPLMMVQIRGLGGAMAEDAGSNGAVRAVPEPFALFAMGLDLGPGMRDAVSAAFGELDAVVERLTNGRRLPNFGGDHQDANDGYDLATLERLREVKRRRDPNGTIRSNKPVLGSCA